MEPQPHGWRSAMNRARLVYAIALSAMVGWGLLAPQPVQAQLLRSLIVTITSTADGSTVSGTVPVTASVMTIIDALTARGTVPVTASVTGSDTNLTGATAVPDNKSTPSSAASTATAVTAALPAVAAIAPDILTAPHATPTIASTFTNINPPTISSFMPGSGPV